MIHNEQPRWWCPACWFLWHAPEPWPTEADVPAPTPGPFLGTRAYKIVRRLRANELWSYLAYFSTTDDLFPYTCPWNLRYFPGHAKRAPIGLIFVFDSLANAQAYLNRPGCREHEIWEADVVGAERLDASSSGNWADFWRGDESKHVSTPKGTLVCNTVTLRQRVA